MKNEQKYGITSTVKLLEDNILKEDVIQAAIYYLSEYAEKKDELDELIKKETLETQKAVRVTSILTKMLEVKAKEDEVTA